MFPPFLHISWFHFLEIAWSLFWFWLASTFTDGMRQNNYYGYNMWSDLWKNRILSEPVSEIFPIYWFWPDLIVSYNILMHVIDGWLPISTCVVKWYKMATAVHGCCITRTPPLPWIPLLYCLSFIFLFSIKIVLRRIVTKVVIYDRKKICLYF